MQKKKVFSEIKARDYLDWEDLLCPKLEKVGGKKVGEPSLEVPWDTRIGFCLLSDV